MRVETDGSHHHICAVGNKICPCTMAWATHSDRKTWLHLWYHKTYIRSLSENVQPTSASQVLVIWKRCAFQALLLWLQTVHDKKWHSFWISEDKVWVVENLTKRNSNTVLQLVRFSATQTLSDSRTGKEKQSLEVRGLQPFKLKNCSC